MLALNHGLTGIIIGAYLPLPIAVPVAFASHFVLDALPHYGIDHHERNTSRVYRLIVCCDTLLALVFAAALIPLHKWNMEITGWAAYAPDVLWVVYYFRNGRSLQIIPKHWFLRFHQRIQRYERPWGIWVELISLAVLIPAVLRLMLD